VPLAKDQDALVERLLAAHADWRPVDRRNRSSHGYRAVHLVATIDERSVEVQVRS
jgi:ppGpp synthetase/RelA/SpoT-type nucleotidyltranferase